MVTGGLYNEIGMSVRAWLMLWGCIGAALANPVDIIAGREFEGQYVALQSGVIIYPFSEPLTISTAARGVSCASSSVSPTGR